MGATTNLGLTTILPSDRVSPDPINANMEALDRLGIDYVAAKGSTSPWSWRRMSSGLYLCWCRMAQQSSSPDIKGEGNYGYKKFSVAFPVTFGAYPQVFVSARQDGNPKVHVCYVEHSATVAEWYLGGMDWGQSADVECSLFVIGYV